MPPTLPAALCLLPLFFIPRYEVSVITGDPADAPERLNRGQRRKVAFPLGQPAPSWEGPGCSETQEY